MRETSGCDFLMLAAWDVEIRVFFLVEEQKKQGLPNSFPFSSSVPPLLYPTTSRAILHLAQAHAIPLDILPWRISRVALANKLLRFSRASSSLSISWPILGKVLSVKGGES